MFFFRFSIVFQEHPVMRFATPGPVIQGDGFKVVEYRRPDAPPIRLMHGSDSFCAS